MGNKYVRKGAAAEVAPPSVPSPAPASGPATRGRPATGKRAAAAAAAATAAEDPLATQRAALQEKQDELEAQEHQQQLQQQQLDERYERYEQYEQDYPEVAAKKRKSKKRSPSPDSSDSDSSSDEGEKQHRAAKKLLRSSQVTVAANMENREGLQNMQHDLYNLAFHAVAANSSEKSHSKLLKELKSQGELLAVAAVEGWATASYVRSSMTGAGQFSKRTQRLVEQYKSKEAKSSNKFPAGRTNICFKCNETGHYARDCKGAGNNGPPPPPPASRRRW